MIVVRLTLSYNHRLHGGNGRAVVVDVDHLDSDGGGAAQWWIPSVFCL